MTSFYLDDFVIPSNLIKTKDFFIFSNIINFNLMEDSYENFKFFFFFFYNNNNNVNFFLSHFLKPTTYSVIFDFFRSDFDEFS
jgi:hypothetical protein